MPPGSLRSCTGVWFNYRFNKSCFQYLVFCTHPDTRTTALNAACWDIPALVNLVEPSGFTVRLHPEPLEWVAAKLWRDPTEKRKDIFQTPFLKSNTDHIH